MEEGQDCVITTKNVEPADGQKLVALTFDDGPSDYTERYLEILKEHDAVGTFFLLGENVESYPELAKKIADPEAKSAAIRSLTNSSMPFPLMQPFQK